MRRKRRVRRSWSDDEKRRIVGQTRVAGVSVSQVARRYDVNANQVFNWIPGVNEHRLVYCVDGILILSRIN